jgi:3-hydroxy-9,10-secoandrosta-1,3,5(10)-triene-9,17-dione monooxygenase
MSSSEATISSEQLVQRARDLVPILAERAPEHERRRSLPPETIDEVVATEIHRCLTPRRWGGSELGLTTAAAATMELARGCASTSWCTMFIAAHAWVLCHFDDEVQEEVFAPDPDVRIAAIFAPMGQARRVNGGYRTSGVWPWSSNIEHSQWMIGGTFIEGETPPRLHFVLFEPGQFTWEDTWFNVGLKGTGSHTSRVDDVFVPERRVIPWELVRDGTGAGVEANPNALYRVPFVPAFYALLGGVALGAVRGAYEFSREWTKERRSSITQDRIADYVPTQVALTETAAEIDAAQLLLDRCIARASDPDALTYRDRIECRRDANFAVKLLVRSIDRLQGLGGARGLFETHPLQRAWRDVHAVAGHIVFNFEAVGEAFGRLELGLEPPPRDPYF